MLRSTPAEGYAACCDAIAVFDVRHRLGEVTAPTLVLAGAEDPACTGELMRELAQGIWEPTSTSCAVPRTCRMPRIRRPSTRCSSGTSPADSPADLPAGLLLKSSRASSRHGSGRTGAGAPPDPWPVVSIA